MAEHAYETIVIYAKDLFGIFLRNARIRFFQQGRLIHEDRFRDGIVAVRIPENVPPGVYDVETTRERDTGDNISTYTVRDFVVPLASHYFDHAHLHGDLKLLGENLDPETILESRKLDPLLYYRLRRMQTGLTSGLDFVTENSGNPDAIRWGGGVSLDETLRVSEGEAVVGGNLHAWDNASFDVPPELGVYEVGLKNGAIVLDNEVDFVFATLYREGYDWVRMEVERRYHPLKRGSDHYFFEGYERDSSDVTTSVPSQDILSGDIYQNEVYGLAVKPGENSSIELDFTGQGPVIFTDRLYVYATLDYFLLFENNALLVALPRFINPHITLQWDRSGLVFSSSGSDGYIRYETDRPYLPSWVAFLTGPFLTESTTPLRRVISVDEVLAGEGLSSWSSTNKTSTATLLFDGVAP